MRGAHDERVAGDVLNGRDRDRGNRRLETFAAAIEEVAFTGRVIYIAYAKQPVAYDTKLFVLKERDIMGSRNALPEDFREVIAMLQAGRFPVDEAVSTQISVDEVPSILERWSESPADLRKIMVRVR